MKKLLAILLIPFCLSSCDNFGTTRIKNLIDLTPKLEVDNPKSNLFSTGIANPFKPKSSSYAISRGAIIGKPAIAKGMMYSIDTNGYVSAFSLKEKKIMWTKDIADPQSSRVFNSGGVLYSDERLYVTYGTRDLVVLDTETGREVMRKEFPDIVKSKPVMSGHNLIIVQTVSNQLIAYDIKTSKTKWMNEGGIEIISSKNQIHPMIHNGHVLASYSSGEVLYLNANSGAEVWRYSLSSSGDVGLPSFDPSVVVTNPIFTNNFVYFATSNGKIVKINASNGAEVWVKTADDVQSMVLHDNNLIVTNNARQVAALSAHDGHINWVGNLISAKERSSKKPKTASFLDPFVVKDGANYTINVISSNGELYQFTSDESGHLPSDPHISKIDKNTRYYWVSCCSGGIYLIYDRNVKF